MNRNMIDLEDFFSSKYKHIDSGLGPAGVSVITDYQMVSRTNFSLEDTRVGSHFEVEGSIMSDIFGIDRKLYKGFGYDKDIIEKMDQEHRRVLGEVVVVKYLSNNKGNNVIIYVPSRKRSITSKQLESIKYINEYVEDYVINNKFPIRCVVLDRTDGAEEFNTMRKMVIPYLENIIDDNYIQSVPDLNIVDEKVKIKKIS